jgi:hypothetical protein
VQYWHSSFEQQLNAGKLVSAFFLAAVTQCWRAGVSVLPSSSHLVLESWRRHSSFQQSLGAGELASAFFLAPAARCWRANGMPGEALAVVDWLS